jgi:hypothetical protein
MKIENLRGWRIKMRKENLRVRRIEMKKEKNWVTTALFFVLIALLSTCAGTGPIITFSPEDITQAISTVYPTKDYVITDFIVTEFGAKAEPGFDNREAFQTAINAAEADGGGVIFIPSGTYEFRSAASSTRTVVVDITGAAGTEGNRVLKDFQYEYVLRLPPGVQLRGDWISPELNGGKVEGTILAVYAGKNSPNADREVAAKWRDPQGNWSEFNTEESVADRFIEMSRGTGVTNLSIWYPEQSITSVVPYPWTLYQARDNSATIENVTLVNSYNGFYSTPSEMHYVFNSFFTVLDKGIKINRCSDIGRIEDVKIDPKYWAESGLPGAPTLAAVTAYTKANSTGFQMHRSDWEYVTNLYISGYKIGMWVGREPGFPHSPNAQFYGLHIDNCETGLFVSDVNSYGALISNSSFGASGGNSRAVYFSPLFSTSVQFNGVNFTGPVVSEGGGGVVSFENCTFDGYNDYALDLKSGNALLTQSEFKKATGHARLGTNFSTLRALNSGYGAVVHERNLVFTDEGKASLEIQNGAEYVIDRMPENIVTDIAVQPKAAAANVLRFIYGRQKIGAPTVDASGALQAALNEVRTAGGGTVFLPGGRYLLKNPIVVPSGVELRGTWDVQHHLSGGGTGIFTNYSGGKGKAKGIPLIRLEASAGLRGFVLYQANLVTGMNYEANPRQTPFMIQGMGPNVYVINLTIPLGDKGIDLASYNTSGHYIEYLGGSLARAGIWVGGGADGGFIRNMQFNPHYSQRFPDGSHGYIGANLADFQRGNYSALKFGDVTNQTIFNNFVFGSKNGIHFLKDEVTGKYPGALTVIGHGTDGSTRGLFVEHADKNTKIILINSELVTTGEEQDKSFIRMGEDTKTDIHADAQLILYNSAFWGNVHRGAVVNAGTLHLYQTNFSTPGNPSVDVIGGSAQVYTSYFRSNGGNFGRLASTGNVLKFSNNYFGGGLNYESEKAPGSVLGSDIMPLTVEIIKGEGLAKKIKLTSALPGTYNGDINMSYPANYAKDFVPIRFSSLSLGEEILLDLPYYGANRIVFVITLDDGRKMECPITLDATIADRYSGTRSLDSGMSPLMIADSAESVSQGLWDGPNDLSMKGNAKWDDDNLYLFLVVTDDRHHSAFGSGDSVNIWNGDGIQVVINMNKGAADGGQLNSYELGFALHESGRVLSQRWYPPEPQSYRPSGWERLFLISRNESAKTTTYDLTIPWKSITRNPARDLKNKLGLSILINDSDGPDTGRLAFEYGGGINFKNYPGVMDLYLLGGGEYESLLSNSAEAAVKKAEQSKKMTDYDMARNFTAIVRNTSTRNALESRLAALGIR